MINLSLTSSPSNWLVGVALQNITPRKHVELAGLGYYLNRTPKSVRDDLIATALVIEDKLGKAVAIVALDLMYADENFTRKVRERVTAETSIAANAICVNCSHSHNAPSAAFVRGVGELDPEYI